ncbi:MAG: protein disulfide oxidoreductase [Anaerolineae bacterium]|jgi:glutaredoxin-like protein
MAMLSNKDREFLQNHLNHTLEGPVRLLLFTQTLACQFCRETQQLLKEVAELSDKITLKVYNFITDGEVAKQYGIKRIPATVVMGERDYGIRFYGIPSGYEFNTLIEDIIAVSRQEHGLSEETLEKLKGLTEPIHMQVFVTPTCPYCPAAVSAAHMLAMASELITADMIESVEFPQMGNKYRVQGVPRTVINEDTFFEGAAPEPLVLARVLQAAGLMTQAEADAVWKSFAAEMETT